MSSAEGQTVPRFACEACGQEMDCPVRMAGQPVDCPRCGRLLLVPKRKAKAKTETPRAKPARPKRPRKLGEFYPFHTKVVGVSKRNDNGGSRQQLLSMCTVGDTVRLVPQPDNPYDPKAVAVIHPAVGQLGYLGSDTARDLWKWLQSNRPIVGSISALTGGTRDKTTRGCNLLIYEDLGEDLPTMIRRREIENVKSGCAQLLFLLFFVAVMGAGIWLIGKL